MRSTFKPEIKKPTIKVGATARMLILYFSLGITLVLGLAFFATMIDFGNWAFLFLVVGMLALGSLHVWLMSHFFEWDRKVLHKSLFTLAGGLVSVIVLFLFLKNSYGFSNFYCLTALAFGLPHFYLTAIEQILSIPIKMYKACTIRNFDDIDRGEITFEENERGLIWDFQTKDNMTKDLSLPKEPVRMFAPTQVFQMPFKKLFKASVLFHNVRLKPESPIQVFEELVSGKKVPYEWYFMHRPIPYLPLKYIDPDKTVAQNGLKFTKRKTNYGREILAPEIMVIRQKRKEIVASFIHEKEEAVKNVKDSNPNNMGAANPRVEF